MLFMTVPVVPVPSSAVAQAFTLSLVSLVMTGIRNIYPPNCHAYTYGVTRTHLEANAYLGDEIFAPFDLCLEREPRSKKTLAQSPKATPTAPPATRAWLLSSLETSRQRCPFAPLSPFAPPPPVCPSSAVRIAAALDA